MLTGVFFTQALQESVKGLVSTFDLERERSGIPLVELIRRVAWRRAARASLAT